MERVIEILREVERVVDDTDDAPDIARLRDGIDLLDRAVLHLLNRRVAFATVIGRIKKAAGQPVYVPERESDVLQNVKSANEGPLNDEAVRRLFERIIDETRSLERRKYQDDPSGDNRSPD